MSREQGSKHFDCIELVPELQLIAKLERMIFGKSRISEDKLDYINQRSALLLVVAEEGQHIGFKLGYHLPEQDRFFSWLGGVHPDHRRQGVAQALLEKQEEIIRARGVSRIYFTTFDRFPAMIQLGLKSGYELVHKQLDDGEMKYWYEKAL